MRATRNASPTRLLTCFTWPSKRSSGRLILRLGIESDHFGLMLDWLGRGGQFFEQREEIGRFGFFRNESLLLCREPLSLEFLQRFQCLEEGAFVAGGVAVKQGQELGIESFRLEGLILTVADTIEAPVGLGHFFYEELFGGRGGLVFFEEAAPEKLKLGRVFAGEDDHS